MNAMRFAARFFIALVLALPLSASADGFVGLAVESGMKTKTLCSTTSAGDPTTPAKTFDISAGAVAIRGYVQRTLLCPSACFDENIAVAVADPMATKISIKVTGDNKCTKTTTDPNAQDAKKDNRGCAKGQTQPKVTIRVPAIGAVGSALSPAKVIGPKSRCDAALSSTVDSLLGNFSNGNIAGAQADVGRLDALSAESAPMPFISNPQDPAQYGAMLKAFDGTLTDSQIADAIKNKPDDVKIIADCAASSVLCTPDKLTQAASNIGIKLNADVTNQIEQMKADWQTKQPSATLGEGDPQLGPDNTFNQGEVKDIDRAKCAIAKIESGSCGGNYGTIGPTTRTGARAFGKYQVMDFNVPSWTAQACGQAMNPYQFLANGDCQEKVFENVFGGYMSSCGSAEAAASKWFSGRCNITKSNDGSLSVGGYVGKFLGVYSNSNMPFGAAGVPYTGNGSPFAQVNPLGAYSSSDQVVCTGTGYCYLNNTSYPGPVSTGYPVSTGAPVSTGNPVSTGGTISTQAPATPVSQLLGTTGTGVTGTTPAAPAVATLLIQPISVKKGSSATVSWSSVGMSMDQPCQLFAGASFMAQGNEGSRTFDTGPVTASSTVTFVLQCFSQAHIKVQQTGTLIVR